MVDGGWRVRLIQSLYHRHQAGAEGLASEFARVVTNFTHQAQLLPMSAAAVAASAAANRKILLTNAQGKQDDSLDGRQLVGTSFHSLWHQLYHSGGRYPARHRSALYAAAAARLGQMVNWPSLGKPLSSSALSAVLF